MNVLPGDCGKDHLQCRSGERDLHRAKSTDEEVMRIIITPSTISELLTTLYANLVQTSTDHYVPCKNGNIY